MLPTSKFWWCTCLGLIFKVNTTYCLQKQIQFCWFVSGYLCAGYLISLKICLLLYCNLTFTFYLVIHYLTAKVVVSGSNCSGNRRCCIKGEGEGNGWYRVDHKLSQSAMTEIQQVLTTLLQYCKWIEAALGKGNLQVTGKAIFHQGNSLSELLFRFLSHHCQWRKFTRNRALTGMVTVLFCDINLLLYHPICQLFQVIQVLQKEKKIMSLTSYDLGSGCDFWRYLA